MPSDAWEQAHRAASQAGVQLRPLASLDDADRILEVMIATWGEHQLVPREMIRALAESGNVPYGASVGDRLLGYVLGWAGVDERDGLHVHSHMLAALPERRHRGIGYALKLAQRAMALEQGIRVARWTFDPLVARNAYFNLHKLGAVADRFERDFYGRMEDELNRGERTDRLVVRWDLGREPGPRGIPEGATVLLARSDDGSPQPRVAALGSVPAARLEVPPDHAELRTRAPAIASAWRDASAEAIEACLAAGLVACGFDREGSAYVFAREVGA